MSLPHKRIRVIGDGRITIPKSFRTKLGIDEGSLLETYMVKDKIVLEVLVQ